MKNRKAFEKEVIALLESIAGNKRVTQIYKDKFKKMSDKALEKWLDEMISKEEGFNVLVPNGEEPGLNISNLLKVAKSIGLDPFERLWITNKDGIETLTDHKALIINQLTRRLSQAQTSKMIYPKDDKTTDSLTGQPTKRSTGNSLTSPEIELLAAYGVQKVAKELHNTRAGDEGAYRAYKALISTRGEASQEEIKRYSTGVRSGKVMKALLVSSLLVPS